MEAASLEIVALEFLPRALDLRPHPEERGCIHSIPIDRTKADVTSRGAMHFKAGLERQIAEVSFESDQLAFRIGQSAGGDHRSGLGPVFREKSMVFLEAAAKFAKAEREAMIQSVAADPAAGHWEIVAQHADPFTKPSGIVQLRGLGQQIVDSQPGQGFVSDTAQEFSADAVTRVGPCLQEGHGHVMAAEGDPEGQACQTTSGDGDRTIHEGSIRSKLALWQEKPAPKEVSQMRSAGFG